MNALPANPELRSEHLRQAEAVITDLLGHGDAEIRAACQKIMNHPGVDGLVYQRAEMTLQAIGGGE